MDSFAALISNTHLLVAVFSCASAQVLKVIGEYVFTKKVDKSTLISTGGMPSSHSAFVVALAASIGSVEGLHTPIFAISCVFAMIVMHDAAGVRRAAGKQAQVINEMVSRLKYIGINPDEKLKELLGHSPIEVVAGAIWGIIVTAAAYSFII